MVTKDEIIKELKKKQFCCIHIKNITCKDEPKYCNKVVAWQDIEDILGK